MPLSTVLAYFHSMSRTHGLNLFNDYQHGAAPEDLPSSRETKIATEIDAGSGRDRKMIRCLEYGLALQRVSASTL